MRRGSRNHSTRGARTLATLVVGVLVAGALSLTAAAAGAADSLANLKITVDSVQIKQKGKATFVDAKDGQALKQGDSVKTDADGRAEIDYTDGSITRLAGFDHLHHLQADQRASGGRQTQGTLSVGETWNRAAKVSETGSFEVKAGGTTAAVEGTAFVAKCVPTADGSQDGRLHVHRGRRRHQGRQRFLGRHLGDGRPVARRAIAGTSRPRVSRPFRPVPPVLRPRRGPDGAGGRPRGLQQRLQLGLGEVVGDHGAVRRRLDGSERRDHARRRRSRRWTST